MTKVGWPYTRRTRRRLRNVIEALGEHGVVDPSLRPFLTQAPNDDELVAVASLLVRRAR